MTRPSGPRHRRDPLLVLLVAALALSAGCPQNSETADRTFETLARWFEEADALVLQEDRESCRRAVVLYAQAVDLAHELELPLWEAEALHRLAQVHRKYLEDRQGALDYYGRALPLYEDLDRIEHQATVLTNMGRIHFQLGEIDRALESWERALPLARQSGDRHGEASILHNQALAARYLGDFQQVLTAYDRSLEIFADLETSVDSGRAYFNRGRLYQTLGQLRPALADLDRALSIGRELDEPRLLAMVLTAVGQIRETEGDLDGALQALEEARRIREETDQERGLAVTLLGLGSVYERLGQPEQTARHVRQALATFRRQRLQRETAQALTALGRLETAAGRTEESRLQLREALSIFEALRDPAGEVQALHALALLERAEGNPAAALERVEATLGGLEALRRRAATHDLRRAFTAIHRDPYDLHIDLLMELHDREPDAGYDERALEAAERSRARSLVDLLTENREPSGASWRADADPELLARERDLETRLAVLDQQRLEAGSEGESATPEQVARLESRLDEVLRELRAVRGRIVTESPKYASLTRPPRFGVREIQERAVDPETLLLEVHLGTERSFLWAVTPDSVESFELPPRAEIEEAARAAHDLLRKSHHRRFQASATATLARLGRLILGPVAGELGDKRLLVAPDGALHAIPFGALPLPGVTPASPLIAAHEVVQVPSTTALLLLRDPRRVAERQQASGRLAVIADPVFDADDSRLAATATATPTSLGRLRYSEAEAEAILQLAGPDRTFRALGFDATREVAMDPQLGRYRIVHLSTHGRIDAERPELSQLVFSRFDREGRARQGALLAHEVFDLHLPAGLVVLSACETALGEEVRSEGLVGLTQGFLSAGAAGVLVSLWKVDDRATARLMERFYRHLFEGQGPAESLRAAQLSLRQTNDWQAPFYWAGFVLQGEWRQEL